MAKLAIYNNILIVRTIRFLSNIAITRLFLVGKRNSVSIVSFALMVAFIIFSPNSALANNLSITNAQISGQNATNGTADIQFDIAWDNSWKNTTNHDATWIFAKYSIDSGASWHHATLELAGTNPNGTGVGSGTAINLIVSTDKVGAFVQRSDEGNGGVSVESVNLVWDYDGDGLAADDTARVQIFGIEMVYIPAGSFSAGDLATSSAALQQGSADSDAWQVLSPGAVTVSNATSNAFYYKSGGNAGEESDGATFTIPAVFPNGYAAFYSMKHEVTEGLWTSFFNTLTATQKLNRDITNAIGKNSDSLVNRNTLAWVIGSATSLRSDRSCSFLSWMDSCAFADWAGLRPITELEFEKMSRGIGVAAVSGEYVWGSTTIAESTTFSGIEDGAESIIDEGANAHYNSTTLLNGDAGSGPLRSGIYATSTSTRVQAGAGFYGVMELSGNLWERVVTIGNANGRIFSGSHGDGELGTENNYEGNATNLDWPGIDATSSRGITGATGSGFKGGAWSSSATQLRASDRQDAAKNDSSRNASYGFRAARSA
jgi:hypothetical protein